MRRPGRKLLGRLKRWTMEKFLRQRNLVGLTPLFSGFFSAYGFGFALFTEALKTF